MTVTLEQCTLCQEFYTQHPLHNDHHELSPGSYMAAVVCAFPAGVFSFRNWNCQTMIALRQAAEHETNDYPHGSHYWMDSSIGVLPIPEVPIEGSQYGFLVMTWYKERGATAGAWVMDDDGEPPSPLKLVTAEAILAWLR